MWVNLKKLKCLPLLRRKRNANSLQFCIMDPRPNVSGWPSAPRLVKIHILLTPCLVSSALSWSRFISSANEVDSSAGWLTTWLLAGLGLVAGSPLTVSKNCAICSDVASGIRFKTSVGVGGSSSVNWHSTRQWLHHKRRGNKGSSLPPIVTGFRIPFLK